MPKEDNLYDSVKKMITTFTFCAANAFQEKVSTNLKNLVEENKFKEAKNPRILTSGYLPNLSYHCLSMIPAIIVRERIEEGTSKFVISGVTAGIETTIGVPLEVMGMQKFLKESYGLDISQRRLDVMRRVFIPFGMRNTLVWIGFNDPSENMMEAAGKGAIAGLVTTLPDTLENFMMRHGPEINLWESFIKACKQTRAMTPSTMMMASLIRAASVGISAGGLSKETREALEKSFDSLFSKAEKYEEKYDAIAPEATPSKPIATNVSEKDTKEKKYKAGHNFIRH